MNPRYPFVAHRAGHRCEYCHAPEVAFNFRFEVEHIQPQSEGGTYDASNLALACRSCNIFKGPHLVGVDEVTETSIRLFNPRRDRWRNHFDSITSGVIGGKTKIGRATVTRLQMNREVALMARRNWIRLGIFP